MTREEIEKNITELEILKKTQAKLKRANLPTPPKPVEDVENINIFTEWENLKKKHGGMANVPFHELGEYLDKFSYLVAYARWTEAVADIEQQTAGEIRDLAQKQLYTIQEGSREIRAATVATEELYIKYTNDYIEKNALYTAVKALRESYESRLNAISREITRRGQDILDVRRQINRGNI